jgi:hypothetical protein
MWPAGCGWRCVRPALPDVGVRLDARKSIADRVEGSKCPGEATCLGLRIVAEGVETDVAYTELSRLGCDQAQDYFMSRPVPAAELDHWLSNRRTLDQPTDTPPTAALRSRPRRGATRGDEACVHDLTIPDQERAQRDRAPSRTRSRPAEPLAQRPACPVVCR